MLHEFRVIINDILDKQFFHKYLNLPGSAGHFLNKTNSLLDHLLSYSCSFSKTFDEKTMTVTFV